MGLLKGESMALLFCPRQIPLDQLQGFLLSAALPQHYHQALQRIRHEQRAVLGFKPFVDLQEYF